MANTIPAVEKAVAVLDILGARENGATQAELVELLRITPSTCYRILQTLLEAGWIRKRSGKRFDLAGGMLAAAMKLVDRPARLRAAQPILERLAAETGLCAKLSVRQGRDQVPILRAESSRSVAVSSRLGVRFPVIEGSVGAALLFKTPDAEIAALAAECSEPVMEKNHPEIVTARIDALRLRGFCFNAGVNRWKIDAMSVPVLDGEKQVAAALTLLGSEEDFRERALPGLGAALRKAAKECARLVE